MTAANTRIEASGYRRCRRCGVEKTLRHRHGAAEKLTRRELRLVRKERESIAALAEKWMHDALAKDFRNAPTPERAWQLVASWFGSFAGAVRVRGFQRRPTEGK